MVVRSEGRVVRRNGATAAQAGREEPRGGRGGGHAKAGGKWEAHFDGRGGGTLQRVISTFFFSPTQGAESPLPCGSVLALHPFETRRATAFHRSLWLFDRMRHGLFLPLK